MRRNRTVEEMNGTDRNFLGHNYQCFLLVYTGYIGYGRGLPYMQWYGS